MCFILDMVYKFIKNEQRHKIEANDQRHEQQECVKYVQVLVNDRLNWKARIKQVNTRLSKAVGII